MVRPIMPVQFYPEEMGGEEQHLHQSPIRPSAGLPVASRHPQQQRDGPRRAHLFLVFPTTGCQEEKTSQTPLLGLGIVWNG